ncbi:MAG: LysR family transcriptional regulator [Spirulina sp. SIO3F2]|nr:LysR family transcriptional regulator [Spirulina sp. SIO3F2]
MSSINPFKVKISQLRALVTVATHHNFSAAALELELSQSTVSHAIAALEDQLGVQLLTRGRQGANLTPVGDRVVHHAQAILQHLEEISHEANRDKGLKAGVVKIAAFRSVATHLLPGAIARLHELYPQIQVQITEFDEGYDVEKALLSHQADISVAEPPGGAEFDTWPLLRDEYVVLLSPHLGPHPAQLTWEQLAKYPLIVPSTSICADRIHHCLQNAAVPVNIAYKIREDSTMIGMVLQGLGATILPRMAAEPIPDRIQVCQLPCTLTRTISAALLRNVLHPPAVYAFLDALRGVGSFSEAIAG